MVFITDQIDYMKLIALLIKGSKNCFIKKKNYFNFKKIFISNNNKIKNDSFNENNSFHNGFQKNFNLKRIIQRQKDKKIAIIHEAEMEAEGKEKENNRYKTNDEENEDRLKNIERNKGEIMFLNSLIPEIKSKYATFLTQNINIRELMRILEEYELTYSKEEAITMLMKNIPELNHGLSQEIIE